MATVNRKPLQGVTNIIRFNWHYYVLAIAAIVVLAVLLTGMPITGIAIAAIAVTVVVSLLVSYYIYDYSNIYNLAWLDNLTLSTNGNLLNIHAGFDETSQALQHKYPHSRLTVFDFYDPALHTEVSIERARKAYPAYPGTIKITTDKVPALSTHTDVVFLIFAAHEIRNTTERAHLFTQLKNQLAPTGTIVVAEHLRNTANLLAYNAGAFHFLPESEWLVTFKQSGLVIDKKIVINPFVVTYFLKKDGNTP